MRLTEQDYQLLEKSYIRREIALAADITRLSALEAAERFHITGAAAGSCAGTRYPYRWPGESAVIAERLRQDHPPIDLRTGKPVNKYMSPPTQRNRIYFPLEDPADLLDVTRDVFISEGEKKYLALRCALIDAAALLNGNGGKTLAMAMSFPGCWSWRGQVGIHTDQNGFRVAAKGVIPDIDRIAWRGRRGLILYDANCLSNDKVRASRLALARELESRGALIYWVDLMPEDGVNGIDDFLGKHGLQAFLELIKKEVRYDWRRELAASAKGKVLVTFGNTLLALRKAPVWNGVLGFNEFALAVDSRKPPPWGGPPGRWTDDGDLRTQEWLEHQGLPVGRNVVSDAVITVAREHPYHPVKEYLDGLVWDKTPRIDDWLTLYLGAEQNLYHRAVGARWLISAVARARKPGCKADHALILENRQGAGKSTTFEILGGEFYNDDIPELGSKDSAMAAASAWIQDMSELASTLRGETEKIKAFLSRRVDRFRPPYGRHIIEVPRQCVFCGTVNQAQYLKDETGGRRFWPVKCGDTMRLEQLRRDRDQLWAEAVVRYERGDKWWLDNDELIQEAEEEQDERFQPDAWEALIAKWLLSRTETTVSAVLTECIRKEAKDWNKNEEMRVAAILNRLGWEKGPRLPKSVSPTRQHIYRPKENRAKAAAVTMRFPITFEKGEEEDD